MRSAGGHSRTVTDGSTLRRSLGSSVLWDGHRGYLYVQRPVIADQINDVARPLLGDRASLALWQTCEVHESGYEPLPVAAQLDGGARVAPEAGDATLVRCDR